MIGKNKLKSIICLLMNGSEKEINHIFYKVKLLKFHSDYDFFDSLLSETLILLFQINNDYFYIRVKVYPDEHGFTNYTQNKIKFTFEMVFPIAITTVDYFTQEQINERNQAA